MRIEGGELVAANNLSDLRDAAAARANLDVYGRIRPVGVVIAGDSTAIASSNATTWSARDFLVWAHLLSGARFRIAGNLGVSGDNAAQLRARLASGLAGLGSGIGACVFSIGTNDATQARTLASFRDDMLECVAICRRQSILPVLMTVAPTLASGASRKLAATYNVWLRRYAAQEGLPLVDRHGLLVDPATGGHLSPLTTDGTHQSAAGAKIVGQSLADALVDVLPKWSPPLPQMDTADSGSLLDHGLFLAGSPVATGWSKTTPGTASIVTDSSILGRWQRITDAGVGDNGCYQYVPSPSGKFAAGDVMAVTGRIACTLGTSTGALVSALIYAPGGSSTDDLPWRLWEMSEDIPSTAAFYGEFVVPPATTDIMVQLRITVATSGNGWVQAAQVGLFNLTALGVA